MREHSENGISIPETFNREGFNLKEFRVSLKFPLNLMGVQASFTVPLIADQTCLAFLVNMQSSLPQHGQRRAFEQFRLVAWTFLGKDPLSRVHVL